MRELVNSQYKCPELLEKREMEERRQQLGQRLTDVCIWRGLEGTIHDSQ